MSAKIIDGRAISAEIRQGLVRRVQSLHAESLLTPGLAVVLVGNNPASKVYVANKKRACAQVGVTSFSENFPAEITTDELIRHIRSLNARADVHGVLVQLPLPGHIDMRQVLEAIDVAKDVDGFHLYNVGGLVVGQTVFAPCTPYGVVELLAYEGITVEGRNVVVVGASNIVGKPLGLMLMQGDATVSICHAKTRDLAQFTILADILVVAAGVPGLIRGEMVRHGAVVIDVGINRMPDNSITGDVDFEAVRRKASYITPVPGGVGPMTVTMLLENTISAAERFALKTRLTGTADETRLVP
ncbi:bifunctional methylenetetrahydrofolate dehydrogenase/methenyltetrahydrofolate cyclohydrolase FolD [Amycolatopsis pithecellobii]|uniref:Bifunctional protein FolD n=1 Tax=Amycolatopsis pithecellobii TaxID=664692 RepID=A0A6N7YXX4_9PSEU|nr:bifunctional methylenetetrahydrofolate dehydrogenase/methenyltetrahydrofolate cyclohydrolase FolD [Amycolatopsis pithecellobii]MTD53743.1 bifunctional methylenetetrahydrofolate dehydrogenase/methenyltetrahydrofolate cyclohydrolase FolD [Amycolatopsis pithecellobii]